MVLGGFFRHRWLVWSFVWKRKNYDYVKRSFSQLFGGVGNLKKFQLHHWLHNVTIEIVYVYVRFKMGDKPLHFEQMDIIERVNDQLKLIRKGGKGCQNSSVDLKNQVRFGKTISIGNLHAIESFIGCWTFVDNAVPFAGERHDRALLSYDKVGHQVLYQTNKHFDNETADLIFSTTILTVSLFGWGLWKKKCVKFVRISKLKRLPCKFIVVRSDSYVSVNKWSDFARHNCSQ